jgi:hypothetical protein
LPDARPWSNAAGVSFHIGQGDTKAMKWEYWVDKMPIRSGGFFGNGPMNVDAVDQEFLNERGAAGWELVSAMPLFIPQNPTDCFVYYYWKRRVAE